MHIHIMSKASFTVSCKNQCELFQ